MRSSIRSTPVDLTRIMVGSEGTLGFIVDAKIGLVPLPKQKSVLTIEFDRAARRARRHAADPEARAVGRRSDGRLHPVARARATRRSTRSGAR